MTLSRQFITSSYLTFIFQCCSTYGQKSKMMYRFCFKSHQDIGFIANVCIVTVSFFQGQSQVFSVHFGESGNKQVSFLFKLWQNQSLSKRLNLVNAFLGAFFKKVYISVNNEMTNIIGYCVKEPISKNKVIFSRCIDTYNYAV